MGKKISIFVTKVILFKLCGLCIWIKVPFIYAWIIYNSMLNGVIQTNKRHSFENGQVHATDWT